MAQALDALNTATVDMSEIYHPSGWRLFDELDVSLDPEGPDQLMAVAGGFVGTGSRVLDVGCRDARHLIALAERFGAGGVGIDPVPWHIERARAAIAEAGMDSRVSAELARIESYRADGDGFDLIWCRDVLEVLPDLDQAVARMADLVASDGVLIAYTTILNGPPDERETELIHEPLGNVAESLVEPSLLDTFHRHGWSVAERLVVGTRWREYLEERDQVVSRDLLRLARLRRTRERVVAEYGESAYRLFEASTQWAVHQTRTRSLPSRG